MNANELRIGNIISVYGTNGNPKGWSEFEISVWNIETCISHPEWFNPSPITEEWLAKLGFDKDADGIMTIEVPKTSMQLGFVDGYMQLARGRAPMSNYTHITTVHQLQNLYLALTGDELKLQ